MVRPRRPRECSVTWEPQRSCFAGLLVYPWAVTCPSTVQYIGETLSLSRSWLRSQLLAPSSYFPRCALESHTDASLCSATCMPDAGDHDLPPRLNLVLSVAETRPASPRLLGLLDDRFGHGDPWSLLTLPIRPRPLRSSL